MLYPSSSNEMALDLESFLEEDSGLAQFEWLGKTWQVINIVEDVQKLKRRGVTPRVLVTLRVTRFVPKV